MKKAGYILSFLLLFCIACKKQPSTYTLPLHEAKPITGEVWKHGGAKALYTDMYITEQYYTFCELGGDTILRIFDKKDPLRCMSFDIKNEEERLFYNLDFIKSNSRYESEKNDIWIVENKREIKQLRLQNDSLSTVNSLFLPIGLTQSTGYNLIKDEIYGVPTIGHSGKAFYFFQPDSGYYWVEMQGATKNVKKHYKQNHSAFLCNLSVNEKQNAIACAFLFFNKIQFTDLRGKLIRTVAIGEDNGIPLNNAVGSLDYDNSKKYMLDVCGSDKHVYCLFNGSKDFEQPPLIVVFKWDGTHVKTYQADRFLKKIAYDKTSKKLIALSSNDQGGRDVVYYSIK